MTVDPVHYDRNKLGWRAVRGELKLQALDRLVMSDITDDVRLLNVYAALGCGSLNEFLGIIGSRSPRNYGRKSEYYLAECLQGVIAGQELASGLSDGDAIDGYGVELRIVYGELDAVTTMRYVKPSLWADWRNRALESQFKDLKLLQHLSNALMAPPVQVPDVTLSAALDRWRTLDALLAEDNSTLLSVIRATVWCANLSKLSDIESYLEENPCILSEAKELLDAPIQLECRLDFHSWNILWGIIKLRGVSGCGMGEVVAKANVSWPSNRLADPISMYYESSSHGLLQRDRMGRVKAAAVERCVAYLAVHGHKPTDNPLSPWEVVKLLNLKEAYLNVLNARYAGERVSTLDACGKRLGVTRERVRQIEAKCGKLALLMHQSERCLAWLKLHIDNIWGQLSADGGVTVDSKDESELALEKKLKNEYRLGLLLANTGIMQLLDTTGIRSENGWSSKTKGTGDIVIKLSGKVKVVDI